MEAEGQDHGCKAETDSDKDFRNGDRLAEYHVDLPRKTVLPDECS